MGVLALRARLLNQTRVFFASLGVMEVETPLLCPTVLPEPHIQPIAMADPTGIRYLPASPEAHMKRLLAAASGPIYQLARVFRQGETGRRHNPEFTMLEWYQPGYTLEQLMKETVELADLLTGCGPATTITYGDAFRQHADVDPFEETHPRLLERVRAHGWDAPADTDRDTLLDFLLTTLVESAFARQGGAQLLTAYPASRAAMARIDPGPPPTAKRFELYVDGVEIANGYEELTDPVEQRTRLEGENLRRVKSGQPPLPVDERFLAALEAGLPPCAGVAVGFDRLVMLAAGVNTLAEVMAFSWDRA